MRRASLPSRLDRLAGQRGTVDVERTVRELAAETGLDPAEVWAEWDHIVEQAQRFGLGTAEQAIARCAEEFGLSEAELRVEYARIAGSAGSTR